MRRKLHYINPGFQGGAALVLSAVVVAGGVLFGVLVHRDVGMALWDAAMRGHFLMETPYDIVRDSLLLHLAGLSATVTLLAGIVFLLLSRSFRKGMKCAIAALRAVEDGDLSTPTGASGLAEIRRFARLVDAMRAETLGQITALREKARALESSGVPSEEFRARWEELKQKIREVAP